MRPLFNSKAVAIVATATAVAAGAGNAKAAEVSYLKNDPIPISTGATSSTITVDGVQGRLTQVEVSLGKLSHTRAQDIDIALTSPAGDTVALMSDACEGSISDRYLAFSSSATQLLGASCANATYKPTNYYSGEPDVWASHLGEPRDQLDDFMAESPNGPWSLLIIDDQAGENGSLATGWSMRLVTEASSSLLPGSPGDGKAEHYPFGTEILAEPGRVVADVELSLNLHHQSPADLDVLLAGPGGATAMLMSDACGTSAVRGLDVTFNDDVAFGLPPAGCLNGHHLATDLEPGDTLPSPAPAGPHAGDITALDGTTAAGRWNVFIHDDYAPEHDGFLAGWSLTVATRAASPVSVAKGEIEIAEGTDGVLTLARGNEQYPLGPATVRVTSTAGEGDLTPVARTVEFARGQETAEVPFTAVADGEAEGAETYELTISDPTDDARIGEGPTAVVTIPANAAPDPGPEADSTAPVISRVKVKRRAVRFTVSETATVRLRVKRGKRVKRLIRAAQPGANRVRVRTRRGRYRVVLVATDPAGNSTTTKKRGRVR